MKLSDIISAKTIYRIFFVISLASLIAIPFVEHKWRYFFTAAATLFIGLILLGAINPKK